MSEENKTIRLNKVAKEFNVGISTLVEFLAKKGKKVDNNPNTKIDGELYNLLASAFQSERKVKEDASKLTLVTAKSNSSSVEAESTHIEQRDESLEEESSSEEIMIKSKTIDFDNNKPVHHDESQDMNEEKPILETVVEPVIEVKSVVKEVVIEKLDDESINEDSPFNIVGKIDLSSINSKTKPDKKSKEELAKAREDKKKADKSDKVLKQEKLPANTNPSHKEKTHKENKPKEGLKKHIVKPIEEVEAIQINIPAEVKEQVNVATEEKVDNFIKTEYVTLSGPKVMGDKIDLSQFNKPKKMQPVASSSIKQDANKDKDKKKRKRIKPTTPPGAKEGIQKNPQPTSGGAGQGKPTQTNSNPHKKGDNKSKFSKLPKKEMVKKAEISSEDIEKQIKETLARLSPSGKSKTSKHRREKRQTVSQQMQHDVDQAMEDQKILKVTEFVTANELATMMDIPVTKIISSCMSLGMFVSINQRLDAEAIQLITEEFGYTTEFVSAEVVEALEGTEEADREEDLVHRAPVVTVMGHVDHGKTSLLDYIRKANVIAGEAGGITQHIGAYEVKVGDNKITFLDTPGHEAFTAMRARGAKITDIAIIVIACDDRVMPQTIEAINHAQAAGVPIIFALNKIDRPGADPEKIKTELAAMNLLVEDWGGKYQCQEISAKQGVNIEALLEKVLLEAELLELKGNPNKRAKGTVIESSLDKGRGYVCKILVQDGSISPGDIVLAGSTYGRVKAMYNERNQVIATAGPSTPLLLLGLNGAPQAGDTFNVMATEKEAKDLSNRRTQLQREQGLRTQKHITLDEIGRRIAIGDFKQLDLIVKGDVDGSVEALSDSLLKLSTPEVQVNVIHKSVGQITESDVLLATASNAIIIGFQVRPSVNARKLAESEQIDIRLYSIIYTAINELKDAIEGMLSPEIQEKIVCNLEIREVFKITKVGTIAGCMCLDGKINRNTKVRVIRDGIVVCTGKLASLKRFKDEVKEVVSGQDCGLNIENFNDIKVGDIVEGYDEVEVKRTLK
ncbi:MAG: infB [Bacteroidetes bacterium]|nr:infB [Bacteroidota bacterium]